jgi:hypothetical protein
MNHFTSSNQAQESVSPSTPIPEYMNGSCNWLTWLFHLIAIILDCHRACPVQVGHLSKAGDRAMLLDPYQQILATIARAA